MATDNSATASLASAMSRLVLDTDLVDMTVTCDDKEWKVHSTILALRSPFFKEAIINSMAEKQEMKIDIREFDPQAMDDVINFMYGKFIEKGSIKFLLEAAERFKMDDLKEDVVRLAKKKITVESVIAIGHLAEDYDIEHLVGECAKFIVKNNVQVKEEDVTPKLTVMILNIYQEKTMAGNRKQENSEEKDSKEENTSSSNYSIDDSLATLMSRLVKDHDLRDLTLTCGDYKWQVHSLTLAVRSPFFETAVTNIVEKRDMKIDVQDFDPEVMEEVIHFMYGTPIGKSPVKFLFEAADRFQMDDLKEDVIKFAKKRINLENAVELGHLGEMYNIEDIVRDCAEFIVENGIEMKEDDLSPKLTVLVLSILKDANLGLKDANMGLLEKLQDCEDKLYKRLPSRIASLRSHQLVAINLSESESDEDEFVTVRERNNTPNTSNYPPNSSESKKSSNFPPNSWGPTNQDFIKNKPIDLSIKPWVNNLSVTVMDNSTPAEGNDTSSTNLSAYLANLDPSLPLQQQSPNRDGSTRAVPVHTQSSKPLILSRMVKLVQEGKYRHPLNYPMRKPLQSLPPTSQWSMVKDCTLPPSLPPPASKTRIPGLGIQKSFDNDA